MQFQVQSWQLIAALDEWATREEYTTARQIATQFPGHGSMYDLTTERSIDSQAMWFIDVLGFNFHWHGIHWCLYNHALADILSTGAGIECLYCIAYLGCAGGYTGHLQYIR